jgi:carbon monoxide dehydrogenase subunit G
METKVESKIGKIAASSEKVYNFLSNFNNYTKLIPPDRVKNWQAGEDFCRFTFEGMGETGLKIIEKEPFSIIKITGEEGSKFEFFIWIQLKEISSNDTRIKLTIKAELNPILKMAVSKPLHTFVDSLVDQIEKLPFSQLI